MKSAQIINLNDDSVLAFDGEHVINDTTQLPIGNTNGQTIQVNVSLLDLMSLAIDVVEDIVMTYRSDVDFWTIDVADIIDAMSDRHKYVARVYGMAGDAVSNMRPFKIMEFAIDNESFEDVCMRLPYELSINGTESWFIWYEAGQQGVSGREMFKAPAYQNGTGVVYANDPTKVTHRGAIVAWS